MTCSPRPRRSARAALRTSIAIMGIACTAEIARAQAPLHSTVFPADSARSRRSTPANTQRSIVDTLTATLAKLEMHETTVPAGGAPHAPHRHVHEELLVIRSGEMEVLQGTVTRIAKPGAVVFMASNEWHGLRNPGSTPATYLVIRLDPHDIPPNGASSTVPPAGPAAHR